MRKIVGVSAIIAGAIFLNEATGQNAVMVNQIKTNLDKFEKALNGGDSNEMTSSAALVAEGVQNLYMNEIAASWVLSELLKIAVPEK